MSIVSNHFPEVLDALNGFDSADATACTCPPDGNGVGDMCAACQAEYHAWREMADAGLPLPGEEYEPCGQPLTLAPLPDGMPF
jgi:hypothetical protein